MSKATYVVQRYSEDVAAWSDVQGETHKGAKAAQKAAKAAATGTPNVAFRCAAVYPPIRAAVKTVYEFETPDLEASDGESETELAKKPDKKSGKKAEKKPKPDLAPEDASKQDSQADDEKADSKKPEEAEGEEAESASEDKSGEPEKIQDAPGESEAEDEDESSTMFSALFDGGDSEGGADSPQTADELF